MKWSFRSMLIVVLALGRAPAGQAAELAELVPANAKAYVQFGNLQTAEQDVQAFAQASGIPLPPGFDLNLLATISGLGSQWELQRGLAVVVLEPTDRDVALLIPVKDAAAALKSLNSMPDGEFHAITVINTPLVALPKDKCLVVGFNKQVLEQFKQPQGITGNWTQSQRELLEKSDLFVHLNVPEWMPTLEMGVAFANQGIAQLKNMPEGAIPNSDPEMLADTLLWYVNGLQTALKQCQSLELGVDFTADSVSLKKLVVFKPGSSAHSIVSKANSDASPYLAQLPANAFLFAGAADLQGLQPTIIEMTRSLWNLPAIKKKLDEVATQEMLDESIELYKSVTGMSMMMDMGGEAGLSAGGYYFVDDPQQAVARVVKSVELSQATTNAFSPFEIKTQVNSKRVAGDQVTELVMDYSAAPDHVKDSLKTIYGSEKLITQFAAVNDQLGFAMGIEGNPIELLTTQRESLTAQQNVAATLKLVPQKPLAVFVANPLGVLKFVKAMATQFGNAAAPFQDADLEKPIAPIAVAVDSDEGQLSGCLIVPSATVKALVEIVHGR